MIVTRGLVGYWNSLSGFRDLSNYNLGGFISGVDYELTANGFELKNNRAYFEIPVHNTLSQLDHRPFSYAFRIKFQNKNAEPIVFSLNYGGRAPIVYVYSSNLGMSFSGYRNVSNPQTTGLGSILENMVNDTEYYVTVVYDGDRGVRLYLNGVLSNTTTTGNNVAFFNSYNAERHLRIGTSDSTNYSSFVGYIDSLKFYNVNLTDAEVLQNYNNGRDIGVPLTILGQSNIRATSKLESKGTTIKTGKSNMISKSNIQVDLYVEPIVSGRANLKSSAKLESSLSLEKNLQAQIKSTTDLEANLTTLSHFKVDMVSNSNVEVEGTVYSYPIIKLSAKTNLIASGEKIHIEEKEELLIQEDLSMGTMNDLEYKDGKLTLSLSEPSFIDLDDFRYNYSWQYPSGSGSIILEIVNDIAYFPVSANNRIYKYNKISGESLGFITTPVQNRGISYDKENKTLWILGSDGRTFVQVNVDTGVEISRFTTTLSAATDIVIIGDCLYTLVNPSSSTSFTIRKFDKNSGEFLKTLGVGGLPTTSLRNGFATDGTYFYVSAWGSQGFHNIAKVSIADWENNIINIVKTWPSHSYYGSGIAYDNSDGKLFTVDYVERTVRNVTFQEIPTGATSGPNDGQLISTTSTGRTVKFIDAASDGNIAIIDEYGFGHRISNSGATTRIYEHGNSATKLAYNTDENYTYMHESSIIRVLDTAAGSIVRTIYNTTPPLHYLKGYAGIMLTATYNSSSRIFTIEEINKPLYNSRTNLVQISMGSTAAGLSPAGFDFDGERYYISMSAIGMDSKIVVTDINGKIERTITPQGFQTRIITGDISYNGYDNTLAVTHRTTSYGIYNLQLDAIEPEPSGYSPTGSRTSAPYNLGVINSYHSSKISWNSDVPAGTTLKVEVSYDNTEWFQVQNNGSLPNITLGQSLSTKQLYIRQTMTTTDGAITPELHSLEVEVNGLVIKPPQVYVHDVDKLTLSPQPEFNMATITFIFTKDVEEYKVMLNGSGYDSGTLILEDNFPAPKDTKVDLFVGYTDLETEGANRINIYGKDNLGVWTPYG